MVTNVHNVPNMHNAHNVNDENVSLEHWQHFELQSLKWKAGQWHFGNILNYRPTRYWQI